MHRLLSAVALSVALVMVGCGASRDRASGTRNGTGAPGRVTPDAGFADSGISGPGLDAGPNGGRDGGTGPTSLDRDDPVSSLTQTQLAELCQRVVDAQGTESKDCDGFTVNPSTYEECVSDPPAGSTCTVGQILDCLDSLNGDLCQFLQSPACGALFEC
jgi:hypothetical protein